MTCTRSKMAGKESSCWSSLVSKKGTEPTITACWRTVLAGRLPSQTTRLLQAEQC